jgi:hypothetical protein
VADAIQIVSDCFFTILQHKTNEKLEEIKMRIIEAETSKDIEKQMELIKEKARLDKILDQRGGDIEQES